MPTSRAVDPFQGQGQLLIAKTQPWPCPPLLASPKSPSPPAPGSSLVVKGLTGI